MVHGWFWGKMEPLINSVFVLQRPKRLRKCVYHPSMTSCLGQSIFFLFLVPLNCMHSIVVASTKQHCCKRFHDGETEMYLVGVICALLFLVHFTGVPSSG